MSEHGVVLFHTTSAVMKAEKLLVKKGFAIKLVPPPRQFSSDCGIAIRFDWAQQDGVRAELESAGLETAGIHRIGAAWGSR
jgi:hypothetical protein